MKIEINYDMLADIVYQELTNAIQSFENDLGKGHNIFFYDEHDKDDAEIQRHIDAFKLVRNWYT